MFDLSFMSLRICIPGLLKTTWIMKPVIFQDRIPTYSARQVTVWSWLVCFSNMAYLEICNYVNTV